VIRLEVDEMFAEAIERIEECGTGEFRKDLPKALRAVRETYEEMGMLTPLHGLVIGAACRRLDEIARELYPGRGDEGTVMLSRQLREFKHREGG
jgi:hypothetical protein